ncbi:MAG: hypothetical protein Q8O30_01635 [Candidatus Omnitrophota bacterium]|nr:hypothetical protein [Candidatus Omnitrophota bacterium]
MRAIILLFIVISLNLSAKETAIFAQVFTDKGCGPDTQKDENGSFFVRPPHYNQQWNGDTLILECYVNENCAAKIENFGYSVENNILRLRYKPYIFGDSANCMCDHKLIYEISGLEKKTYTIILENIDSTISKIFKK